ncbi:unnamed protein product [Ascophyllum nodosum]
MSLMSMLQSPNELGPRAALLQHYNVVKQHTEQSKSRVSCKGCSHTFAGKTTRMAAHYMQTAGESVSLCKSPPEGATDAATAHFSALEKKRVTTKKRKAVQLIDSGEADLDAGDNEGQTPLHIACYKNYVGIVKQLVEAGADVTKGDKVGNTPLHTAAVTGAFSVVKYLLERGVPCDPQNLEGLTPLTLAERKAPPRNKAALLRLLREYEEKVREDGGDVTCRREGQAGSNHATGVSARANGNRTIDGTLAAAAAGTRSFGGGDDAGASDRGEGVLGQEMEAMDALSRALRRQQETIDRLTEVVQTQARTIADLVTEMGRRSAEERLPYAGGGGGGSGVDRNDVPDQEVEEVEEY